MEYYAAVLYNCIGKHKMTMRRIGPRYEDV